LTTQAHTQNNKERASVLPVVETTDNRGNDKKPRHAASQVMPKLAYRHKLFADKLLSETDKNPTNIVKEIYGYDKTNVASVQANRLLKKDNIQAYLELHGSKAVEQINDIANEVLRRARVASDRDSAPLYNIAMTGKKDIADRALGKATQRTEQLTTGVTLHIDLTSSLAVE
jgi:hypothetical protein